MTVIKSFNPIEPGPAVWIEGVLRSDADFLRVRRQVREYPDGDEPIDIVMNGGGGNSSVGLKIYSMLRDMTRPKRVTIISAPSMGSIIAMAGDHIRIVPDGTLFLHNTGYSPDQIVNSAPAPHLGATALRMLARSCDAADQLHRDIYQRRTGLDRGKIENLLDAETTLNATEAVELGFADEVVRC